MSIIEDVSGSSLAADPFIFISGDLDPGEEALPGTILKTLVLQMNEEALFLSTKLSAASGKLVHLCFYIYPYVTSPFLTMHKNTVIQPMAVHFVKIPEEQTCLFRLQ